MYDKVKTVIYRQNLGELRRRMFGGGGCLEEDDGILKRRGDELVL